MDKKATDKNSPSPPRGLSLAFHCAQLRVNRVSRTETIKHLTQRLASEDEVSPPLPPDWYLEFDPEDRLWLMWPSGRRAAHQVWLYTNPFKPAPPSEAIMRALYPGDYLDDEESPPTPPANTPATPSPPLKTKVWWADIRKEHPQRRDETPDEYAHRLHGLLLTANVTKIWSFETVRRRLYDK